MWDYAQSYHLRPQTSISTSPQVPQCIPVSSFYLSYSLILSSSLKCPTPCTFTFASSYSPFFVVWPSLPSPLTHTSPCSPESKGILTNSENSLGTCSRHQMVFGSGSLLKPHVLEYQSYQGCALYRLALWSASIPPTFQEPLGYYCPNL